MWLTALLMMLVCRQGIHLSKRARLFKPTGPAYTPHSVPIWRFALCGVARDSFKKAN